MVLFEIADSHIKYMLVKGLILFPGSAILGCYVKYVASVTDWCFYSARTLVVVEWGGCEQVLFVRFTLIPPRLTDQCNFITVL